MRLWNPARPCGILHPPLPSAVIPMPLLQRAWNSAGDRAQQSHQRGWTLPTVTFTELRAGFSVCLSEQQF